LEADGYSRPLHFNRCAERRGASRCAVDGPTRPDTDAGTVTSHADRAGELSAERRQARDERD
jgi:hypothetical protein